MSSTASLPHGHALVVARPPWTACLPACLSTSAMPAQIRVVDHPGPQPLPSESCTFCLPPSSLAEGLPSIHGHRAGSEACPMESVCCRSVGQRRLGSEPMAWGCMVVVSVVVSVAVSTSCCWGGSSCRRACRHEAPSSSQPSRQARHTQRQTDRYATRSEEKSASLLAGWMRVLPWSSSQPTSQPWPVSHQSSVWPD